MAGSPKACLAHDALTILFDDNWRRAVRIDVQGFVAAAHHLFEVPADQPVVPDQVADFPRRERVEIAHGRSLARAQWSLVSSASTCGRISRKALSRLARSTLGVMRGEQ